MKMTIEYSEATGPYWDNASPYKVTVETEEEEKGFQISEGEPEDMSFGRNLNGVFSVPDLIKAAYEAGKRGEDIEIEEKKYDW